MKKISLVFCILLLMVGIGVASADLYPYIYANPQSGDAPLTVAFTGSCYGGTPTTWTWDFGDGGSSTEQSPSHQYPNAGKYTVKLFVNKGISGEKSTTLYNPITVNPVAAFTASPESGPVPLTIQFTDASIGNPTSWTWDFGDGTTSNVQNPPSHTYNAVKKYTVKLTVKSGSGGNTVSDYVTKTITVTPGAAFTATPESGTTPLTVQFTDASTGSPDTYAWTFGDGGSSNVKNPPAHPYVSAGSYIATLTVTKTIGTGHSSYTLTNSTSKTITVTDPVVSPVVSISGPSSGTTNADVTFTGNLVSGNAPDSWNWEFGDGGSGAGQSVSHAYIASGTYIVNLTATNDGGTSPKVSQTITVTDPVIPPVVSISGPSSGTTNTDVTFTGNLVSGGTPDSWNWEFGDGGSGAGQSVSHAYTASGTYIVNLTATNVGGTSPKVSQTITVIDPVVPPVVSITGPSSGTTNTDVTFTGNLVSGGAPDSWNWEFGDDATGTGQSVAHAYTAPGTYIVNLTATNVGGTSPKVSQTITVTDPVVPPVVSITGPSSGTTNTEITFTGNLVSGGAPDSWNWEFGDDATGTGQSVAHAYTGPGTYIVNLTATNDGGTSPKVSQTITVTDPVVPPVVSITGPSSSTTNTDVTFTGNLVSGGAPDSWDWEFGDGGSGAGQSVSHAYTAPGTYIVNLTATNDGGTSPKVSQTITVAPSTPAPTADFTFSQVSGTKEVQFTDASTGAPTSWAWEFGDGYISSQQNPKHPYTSTGSKTVKLTVTNAGGSNSVTKTVTVTEPTAAPTADFTFNQVSGTLGIQFTDTSTGSPTSWAWDFGDSTSSTEKSPLHTYASAGSKTVKLTVTNAGGSNAVTKTITVTSLVIAPVAAFTTSTNSGVAPLTVQFTDSSSGGTPTSWAWTFGDGGTSTVQNPSHQYTSVGTFTATLVVTNTAGQTSASSTITVRSANVPVKPKITSISPTSGQQGGKATVTITGTNFEKDKVKVSVSGKGVTVGAYKTRNTNKIVVPFTIAKTATTGTRTVTVTNPSSNLNDTKKFTITAAPKITKINPTSGKQGKTVKVTITGKNFEKGKSTVIISGKGISVTKYVTRNADKIVANIKIASGATASKRTVTIKNPTWGVTATTSTKFTVLKAKGTSTSDIEPVSSVSNGVLSSPVLSSSSSTSSPKSLTQSGTGLIQVTPPSLV